MLVIQPSAFSSRRNEDGAFNPPVYQGRRYGEDFKWPYDLNDDRFKPTMDKERDVGTVYSADSTSLTSPGPNATGPNTTFTPRENQTPAAVVADDIVAMSLAITTPPADAFLSQNSQESSPMTPLVSFAIGLSCRNDEYEKTAKAARKISRRLTMEGRRDGLDFLNIGGLMKWPHGTSSITPTPAPKSAGMETYITSAATSPVIITAAHFLVSRRDHNDLLECNSSPSTDMKDMLSIIGNSSMTEEDDKDGEIENGVTACSIDRPVDVTGLQSPLMCMSKKTIGRPIELHARLDASEIHRNYDLHTTLMSQGKDNTQIQSSCSSTLSSLSGRLPMDNICQRSREALTRLQEEDIEAILGTTLPTVPLSLATLQMTRRKSSGDHGGGISVTDLGDADRVHTDASKISLTSALVDKAQQLHASVE
ncbi:hypothetical protein BGZ98_009532 [Dissophora globulifera]|nr:hypothetical protein BGZ98_009532 [Dissophora globulifera]